MVYIYLSETLWWLALFALGYDVNSNGGILLMQLGSVAKAGTLIVLSEAIRAKCLRDLVMTCVLENL